MHLLAHTLAFPRTPRLVRGHWPIHTPKAGGSPTLHNIHRTVNLNRSTTFGANATGPAPSHRGTQARPVEHHRGYFDLGDEFDLGDNSVADVHTSMARESTISRFNDAQGPAGSVARRVTSALSWQYVPSMKEPATSVITVTARTHLDQTPREWHACPACVVDRAELGLRHRAIHSGRVGQGIALEKYREKHHDTAGDACGNANQKSCRSPGGAPRKRRSERPGCTLGRVRNGFRKTAGESAEIRRAYPPHDSPSGQLRYDRTGSRRLRP